MSYDQEAKTVLVTGANGFIGRHLCAMLVERGYHVVAAVREISPDREVRAAKMVAVGDLSAVTDWSQALLEVDVVVHLAGAVHLRNVTDDTVFQRDIAQATLALAKQARKVGVQRFIYMSSASVYGKDDAQELITEETTPLPSTPYGCAKLAAERSLLDLAEKTNWELLIIRPPGVYGVEARDNMQRIKQAVSKLPVLPLGGAKSKRSLVAVDNLVDFIGHCIRVEYLPSTIVNVTDDHDITVAEFCALLAKAMGRRRWLFPMPKCMIRCLMTCFGLSNLYPKLFGQFQMEVKRARDEFEWSPPYTPEKAIQKYYRPPSSE